MTNSKEEKKENTRYTIINKEDKSGSEIEFTVSLPKETLNEFKQRAVDELKEGIEVDGFRKGNAPEEKVLEKVGDMAVTERTAYNAINNIVPVILMSENLNALTMPGITITKIAPESDLEFKLSVTLMPEVELSDYKKIAKEIKEEKLEEIGEKEVDEYINYIRKQRAQAEAMSKSEKFDEEKTPLPVFDDEFVKTLGNFDSVDKFKEELKKNMLEEKKTRTAETRRIKIIEGVIEKSKIDVPEILVEEELGRMLNKFKFDIEQMKMNPEDYLKQIKKTEDDLKKEWKTDAEKRAKMNLILPKIAEAEKIEVPEDEVEKETKHLLEHQKDLDESQAKMYIQTVLKNEAVFKFLESQK